MKKGMTPKQLIKIRNKLKYSQAKMAKELGISERFLLYRERGEREIPEWLGKAAKHMMDESRAKEII